MLGFRRPLTERASARLHLGYSVKASVPGGVRFAHSPRRFLHESRGEVGWRRVLLQRKAVAGRYRVYTPRPAVKLQRAAADGISCAFRYGLAGADASHRA